MKTQLIFLTMFFVSVACIGQPFQELSKQYSQGSFDSVIAKGYEILRSSPDEPQVNMLVGRALADKGDFKNAIPYLLKATDSETEAKWIKSWSYGYLGTCYFMIGKSNKAGEALQNALDLDATRNSNKYAFWRTLLFGTDRFYKNWTKDSTDQIIFHFQEEANLDKDSFMSSRQKALDNILTEFPANFPKKIDFFVWESEQDAMKILRANLGFSNPAYLLTHSRKNQTSGHELTHIVLQYSIHPTSKTRFINEGIATLHDQTDRDRMKVAEEALSRYGKPITVKDLWRHGRDYSEDLVYAIGAAWLEHCVENLSDDQLRTLLKNQTYNGALEFLGTELTDAMATFENKLTGQ